MQGKKKKKKSVFELLSDFELSSSDGINGTTDIMASSPTTTAAAAAATVLVTGCSRGIGLELVRQLLDGGMYGKVLATCRNPAKADALQAVLQEHGGGGAAVEALPLDVASEESIAQLPKLLEAMGIDGIDALVHNAGIAASTHPIDPVASTSKSEMMNCFSVNCCGPLLLTQALMPSLRKCATGKAKVMFIGSRMGCPQLVESTGEDWTSSVSYRVSKAAVHMLMRCFDQEVSASSGICFTAATPGWVRTDMGNAGGRTANLEVDESVAGLVRLLGAMEQSSHGGRFFDYLGEEVPL